MCCHWPCVRNISFNCFNTPKANKQNTCCIISADINYIQSFIRITSYPITVSDSIPSFSDDCISMESDSTMLFRRVYPLPLLCFSPRSMRVASQSTMKYIFVYQRSCEFTLATRGSRMRDSRNLSQRDMHFRVTSGERQSSERCGAFRS